jgi:hypothetical protein
MEETKIQLQFMTTQENYVAMAQELAATKLHLKMAMRLLSQAQPQLKGEAAERWLMQLEGLFEEVSK